VQGSRGGDSALPKKSKTEQKKSKTFCVQGSRERVSTLPKNLDNQYFSGFVDYMY